MSPSQPSRPAKSTDSDAPINYTPPLIRGGSPLANVLVNAITRMDSATQVRESLALAYWSRVVGPQGAAATQADSVRDGILFVRTKSSVWSHELTLHKARLIQSLNSMLGGPIIRDLIFRAQGVKKREEAVEVDTPTAEDLAAVVLEADEKAELRARLQSLYTVNDEHARNALAARLVMDARLRRWRLERGWRVCTRCSAVHKTEYRLCPICRLCR